jgi:hypothetical protein
MKTTLGMRFQRLLWTPVRLEAYRHVRAWHRAVADAAATQARLLADLLAQTDETAFGRDFSLARVRTIDDLRRAMPIAGFERAAPYVDRVAEGETTALFPAGTAVHMFAMTSGTTGEPKRIPVTDLLLKRYREGWHVWGVNALDDHIDAFGARLLQIASRMDEETTPSGIPAGAMSGLTAHAQRRLVRRLYVMPPDAARAATTADKYYLACRLGLQHNRIMPLTANPSTLLGLARAMDDRKEALLRDLADGTLCPDLALDPADRRRIAAGLRPMRRRAARLEDAIRRTGHLFPKEAWELPLIGTWKGGTLGLYLREIPAYWGDAPVRDIGLLASEGRFSVPLATNGSAGVLEVAGTFYEFVPEEEISRPNPTALLAHEVEEGRRYYIILTTPSGLFRYNIGDVVRVVGRVGQAPVIEFLNKGQHTSNLTGEKLTEHQVTTAVNATVAALGLTVRNYAVCPTWEAIPYYSLLVEEGDVPAGLAPALATAVDAALQGLNIEYETKRASCRLAPLRVKMLPRGTWDRYDQAAVQARRGRVEQYKHKFLVADVDFVKKFAVLATYAPPHPGWTA